MHTTAYDGILFVEGEPPAGQCRIIEPIDTEIGGIFSQAQLKSLRDLKAVMAKQAKSRGGNAIINFEYGQRSVGFLRSLWQLDDVNWYGSGHIAVMSGK